MKTAIQRVADAFSAAGRAAATLRYPDRDVAADMVLRAEMHEELVGAISALAEGRRFVGVELEPAYVEIARRRLAGAA